MTDIDYESIGLTAGLEIHQQLDTPTKLFCRCPTDRREPEEAVHTIRRSLHPTKSELGELDAAALEESSVDRTFEYLNFDSTCLVEADDEPPKPIDETALSTTIEIAHLMDMSVLDQVHVMRKIVVDGSNTSGFQRTALVATDGTIETEHGEVGIEDLLLEEESAQRVSGSESEVTYSLDRLGIPLVEIGTSPDIHSPEQARAVAERIGMLLRSTGQVKRGIGTIRQDVNVSIENGARVEIKGVQQLDDIDDIVRTEVDRQVRLLDISDRLQKRDASIGQHRDITAVFEATDSGVIRGALDNGGSVYGVCLHGFDGLLGEEIAPDRRLGTELSDHAKRHGAGGIFHTDELPAYGISDEEVDAIFEKFDTNEADAVAIVADTTDVAMAAIEAVAERAESAIDGVPEETRGANPDGSTRYLRPLPGAARMYPETDVPPVDPDPTAVDTPELLTEKIERYRREYGFDEGLARQIAFGASMADFEHLVANGRDPMTTATTLESTLTELRRDDVPIERLTREHIDEVLRRHEDGDLAREAIQAVLKSLAVEPERSVDAAIDDAGVASVDEADVQAVIDEVAERNAEQIESEGMGAFSALMGECMGALRGRADGDTVSELLREEIQRRSN